MASWAWSEDPHTMGQRKSSLLKSGSRRVVINNLREVHCQSRWNSNHFQRMCPESMLSVDAGASLLRNTARRTIEMDTNMAGSPGMMMMVQG